jgi:hypothetical protein
MFFTSISLSLLTCSPLSHFYPYACPSSSSCPLLPDPSILAHEQPSELAPASSALLAELLPRYLDPEAYAVINGAVEHTTKLMELQWGHGRFRIFGANLMDSPLHGLRKRGQNHRWCSSQDSLAIDLGSESSHLSTPVTTLTTAWRQEPSHCLVLRKPPDIG